jgi:hypothetical protein
MPEAQVIILDTEQKRERAIKVLSLLPLDKPQELTIQPFIERRTNAQNARLWKLHGIVADHLGVGSGELHDDMLCLHFGYVEKKLPSGAIKRVPLKRSSPRDKKEFSRFMDYCETFYISEFGIWLP